jgi:protein ImuB
VVEVRLAPEDVVEHGGAQLGLWGDTGADDERAHRALTRVQGLLGPDAVVTAVLGGGRDPEARVRYVAWRDAREPALPLEPPWPGRLPPPAPATVPPSPPPVSVLGLDGQPVGVTGRHLLTGLPAEVRLGDSAGRTVRSWAGPWPADERWWSPVQARRRAWLQVVLDGAQSAEPSAFLLALEGGTWQLAGIYD